MATTTHSLTEREQETLDHLQRAQELGCTLVEYCRTFGVDVKKLYAMRKPLVRKGILPPAGRKKRKKPAPAPEADTASAFVPVRIVPSVSEPAPTSPAMALRLTHSSGWTIECGSFPPASWLAAVLAGDSHAAA